MYKIKKKKKKKSFPILVTRKKFKIKRNVYSNNLYIIKSFEIFILNSQVIIF